MNMLSVKSPYLSEITDLNYGENSIDLLVKNNTGVLVQLVPKHVVLSYIYQIYQGYSEYF
jgi:hypothetical protein